MNYDRAKALKEALNNNSCYFSEKDFLKILVEIELDKIIDKHESIEKTKEHLEKPKRDGRNDNA